MADEEQIAKVVPSETTRQVFLAKDIVRSVGWLTGSTAGIAAVFYTCGFLIISAHLSSLGISGLINSDKEQYLIQGAKFFVHIVMVLFGFCMGLFGFCMGLLRLSFSGVGFLLALCLLASLLILYFVVKRILLRTLIAVFKRIEIYIRRHRWLIKVLFAAGIVISVVILISPMERFQAPLSISGLLFVDQDSKSTKDSGEKESEGLQNLLVNENKDNRSKLHKKYGLQIFYCLLAGVFFYVAKWVCSKLSIHVSAVTPIFIILVYYLMLLPLNFGVMVKTAQFPYANTVRLSPERQIAKVFILGKNEKELLLWDKGEKELIWIPMQQIREVHTSCTESLFSKQ